MKELSRLFCESAKTMSPYSPIEPPDQIAKRLGLPESEIIKLDANENPYGVSQKVLSTLGHGKYFHIYPDPAQVELRKSIGDYLGCDPDMIVGGTGADEIIDIVCRLVLEPGQKVIGFTPSFSYYSHVVALNKGVYETYSRNDDFSISIDTVKSISLENAKLVVLCSPNNPSGNLLEEDVLDYFLRKDILVMVDEAYHEFSRVSYLDKLKDNNNLIILRTFSKCFALAGLRIGYGVMSKELASSLMRIKPPFSVNMAAEVAIATCLRDKSLYDDQVNEIIETREWVYKELQAVPGVVPFPSASNFILCRIDGYSAQRLFDDLQKIGILVRYFSTNELKNYIRISMGTRPQMERFLEELRAILS